VDNIDWKHLARFPFILLEIAMLFVYAKNVRPDNSFIKLQSRLPKRMSDAKKYNIDQGLKYGMRHYLAYIFGFILLGLISIMLFPEIQRL
jgi:hypothetical protein